MHTMPKLEVECMIRSTDTETKMPVTCMPKSHKGKGNPPLHVPVLTIVGIPFH